MTPAQLNELRRQRALVQQHLDWLDREITGAAPPPALPPPDPTPPVPTAAPVYEPDPVGASQAARRGCLLYAALTLALLAAALVALYFWRYRDRPLLFAPAKAAQGEVSPARVFDP
jgi:hypothetical protein